MNEIIINDGNLELAFQCIKKQRLKADDNDTILSLCLNWQAEKVIIISTIRQGTYRFSPIAVFVLYRSIVDQALLSPQGQNMASPCVIWIDILVLTKTRAHLRRVVRDMHHVLEGLYLRIANKKTYSSKSSKGFDFLGYRFMPPFNSLTLAKKTIDKSAKRMITLYEQRGCRQCLDATVKRFMRWARLIQWAGVGKWMPNMEIYNSLVSSIRHHLKPILEEKSTTLRPPRTPRVLGGLRTNRIKVQFRTLSKERAI